VIRYIFGACGNILEIRWQQDKMTGAFKGNGWIEFDTESALNKALAQDGVVIEGQSITVARAVSKDPQYEANSTIHIKNLPQEMSDAEIRSLFQHIGVPKAVRIGKDSTGTFAGRAWVEFEDAHTATLALSLNLANVRGHVIEISFAKPKTGGPTPQRTQVTPTLLLSTTLTCSDSTTTQRPTTAFPLDTSSTTTTLSLTLAVSLPEPSLLPQTSTDSLRVKTGDARVCFYRVCSGDS